MKCLIFFVCFLNFLTVSQSQIHRATNSYNYQIRYNSNFTYNYLLKKISNYEFIENSDSPIICAFYNKELIVWLTSVIGTFFIGICGILPVVLLPSMADDHQKLSKYKINFQYKVNFFLVESNRFKCCLSFAAGTLLGDVFLHLLPEAYTTNILSK